MTYAYERYHKTLKAYDAAMVELGRLELEIDATKDALAYWRDRLRDEGEDV